MRRFNKVLERFWSRECSDNAVFHRTDRGDSPAYGAHLLRIMTDCSRFSANRHDPDEWLIQYDRLVAFTPNEILRGTRVNGRVIGRNMPRSASASQESWGGKQIRLLLPTTQQRQGAKSSATGKLVQFVSFVTNLGWNSGLKKSRQSSPSFATCQVIHLHICCNNLASKQAHPP